MGAALKKYRGCDYMPMKLKEVLVKHGISQPTLAAEIKQAKDVPLSRTALSQIINWGYYPRNTTPESIRDQIKAALLLRGIPPAELEHIFEVDGEDKYRLAFPIGSHVGKPAPKPPGFGKRHGGKGVEGDAEQEFEAMEVEMLSPAAKRHFKLFRDPFQDDIAGPEDVFLSDSQRYFVEAILQTALVGGITCGIGESGSGKTTLRKFVQHRIASERKNIRIIFPQTLDKTKLSTGAICTAIIKDLEPDSTVRSSLEAQARQVKEVLLRSGRAGFKHVLMIEEAHDLSIQTLKYLKRFHEIESEDGFGKLLSIVLVAQPEMRIKLDANRYPEAREFINRCEVATLEPLHRQVGAYLAHKFGRAGSKVEEVFTEDAFEAIQSRWTSVDPQTHAVKTYLYPLIVNNTATRAMNRAAELGVPVVNAELVRAL